MNDVISSVLFWVGFCMNTKGLFVLLRERCRWRAFGWCGSANLVWLVMDVLDHARWIAAWTAMWAAYYLWVWWNGGGGDNTKKRLKKWARKFTPVRRTAPQMG